MTRLRATLSAISLSSGISLFTVFISLISNKFLAVFLGPSGIALMGLFRSFSSVLARSLGSGVELVVNQRVSLAKNNTELLKIQGATFLFCLFQIVPLGVILLFLGDSLSGWFQRSGLPSVGPFEMKWLFLMSYLNMGLQVAIGILSGLAHVKKVAAVQFFTALGSLLLIRPLIALGTLGLAINVGSGSLVGLFASFYFLKKEHRGHFKSVPFKEYFLELRQILKRSYPFIVHPAITFGSVFLVQSLIGKNYLEKDLGCYMAAFTVMETLILILLASVRSYFLPAMGKASGSDEKVKFQTQVVLIFILVFLCTSSLIVTIAPWLMRLLFSEEFSLSADLIKIICVAGIAQGVIYCYNAVLLHYDRFKTIFVLDIVWAVLHFGLAYFAIWNRWSIYAVTWMIGAGHLISMLLHIGVVKFQFGFGPKGFAMMGVAAFSFFWLVLGQNLPSVPVLKIIYVLVAAIFSILVFQITIRPPRPAAPNRHGGNPT